MLAVHMVEGQPVPPDEDVQRAYKAVDDFNRDLQESAALERIFRESSGPAPHDVHERGSPQSTPTLNLAWG